MNTSSNSVKIGVTIRPQESEVEWLRARAIGDAYEIIEAPSYATGISPGDLVTATPGGEGLFLSSVVRCGGMGTLRMLVHDDIDPDNHLVCDLLERMLDANAKITKPWARLFVVSATKGPALDAVLRVIQHGEEQRIWMYEIGNLPR
jgi:hypothetical protein